MAEQDMQLPINESPNSSNGSRITGDQGTLNDAINVGYQGSLQQMLATNTGNRVVVDFLVGTSNIVRKEGILYLVGVSYIVLYDDKADTYTVCNLYSIEFVTFLSPNGGSQQVARTTLKRV